LDGFSLREFLAQSLGCHTECVMMGLNKITRAHSTRWARVFFMVSDAILLGGQTQQKLQSVSGKSLMPDN